MASRCHMFPCLKCGLGQGSGADARCCCPDVQEGDSVIIDVDADGQVSVLNGEKKMTQMLSETPAGIS